MKAKFLGVLLAVASIIAADNMASPLAGLSFIGEAQARIGRPLTPGSVAGVSRRTTRRVVRRSSIYVAALPGGCVVTPVNGANYWRCGGTYYAAQGAQYVVVYID